MPRAQSELEAERAKDCGPAPTLHFPPHPVMDAKAAQAQQAGDPPRGRGREKALPGVPSHALLFNRGFVL